MMKKLESVQYNAALIVSGCCKGTSMDKIYTELGCESLDDRRNYLVSIARSNNLTPKYIVSLA